MSLLHPEARARVHNLMAALNSDNIPLLLYEGARTPWRQAELYARGRTIPGTKKVTRAMAWQSRHNFGLAADFVFYVGGKWTWDEPSPGMWNRYIELARTVGLETLDFEMPHVQLSYPMARLARGLYPEHGDATWEAWLEMQIEQWGSFRRDHGGILHPGAPPPLDIDGRPELVA